MCTFRDLSRIGRTDQYETTTKKIALWARRALLFNENISKTINKHQDLGKEPWNAAS